MLLWSDTAIQSTAEVSHQGKTHELPCPSVVFQPSFIGTDASRIHDASFQNVMKCDADIQEARQVTENSFPSGLDLCSFLLDDGLCAGTAPAVSSFLAALVRGLSRIGLVVNFSKTEVIPACTTSQSFGPDSFPGCSWNGSACFLLLGEAKGCPDWCELLLSRRIAKARALIDAIGRFPDAQ